MATLVNLNSAYFPSTLGKREEITTRSTKGTTGPRAPEGRASVCCSLLGPECLFSPEWFLNSSVTAFAPGAQYLGRSRLPGHPRSGAFGVWLQCL